MLDVGLVTLLRCPRPGAGPCTTVYIKTAVSSTTFDLAATFAAMLVVSGALAAAAGALAAGAACRIAARQQGPGRVQTRCSRRLGMVTMQGAFELAYCAAFIFGLGMYLAELKIFRDDALNWDAFPSFIGQQLVTDSFRPGVILGILAGSAMVIATFIIWVARCVVKEWMPDVANRREDADVTTAAAPPPPRQSPVTHM